MSSSSAQAPAEAVPAGRRRLQVADVICVGGFVVVGIYSLVVISFIPSLVGRDPVLLEALGGSVPSMVAAGAFARVGRASLLAALAAPVVGLSGFDWLPWWAGRRYGRNAIETLAGRSDRSRRLAARAERLFARHAWAAVVTAYYLPIPNVVVYAAAGSTGMSLPVFLMLDLTGSMLRIGLVVGLGYAIGSRAVSLATTISHYTLLSLVAMTLLLIAYRLLRHRLRRPDSSADQAVPTVSALPAWPPFRAPPLVRAGSDAELTELVQRHLRPLVDQGIAPGIVYAAVSPHACALGCLAAPGQRLDAESLVEIGSITKVFTGILLADMAERGEVACGDPITRYLQGGGTAAATPITLLDLATHTSGLPRLPANLLLPAFRRLSDPYSAYHADLLVRAAARSASRGRPTGGYRYSNYGFGLLGHLLAEAAGRPYEDLIHERVCGPLGLPDTMVTVTADREDRRAIGHRRNRTAAPWHLSALAGAGGLHSTGVDLLTFLRANLAPETTPLAAALEAAQRPRLRSRSDALIGLAWQHTLDGQAPLLWHNGGTGGFSSIIVIDRANGNAVAAVATTAPTPAFPLDHAALAALAQISAFGVKASG